MGRARGGLKDRGTLDPSVINPVAFDSDELLRDQPEAVGEILELPDESRMTIEEGDPASLLRGLVQVTSINYMAGNYEITFADGDAAILHTTDGRIAFASGESSSSKILAAFAMGLGARSASGDALGLSNDPETKRLYQELSELYKQLAEDPYNQDLLRQFAATANQLMQSGHSYVHEDMSKPVMPPSIEVNGAALVRRLSGLPEEDEFTMSNSARLAAEYSDAIHAVMKKSREAILAQGDEASPVAQLAARSPAILFFLDGQNPDEMASAWTDEMLEARLQGALRASGQIDENGRPTGLYDTLSPFLDGTNPKQAIGIPISRMYDPNDPTDYIEDGIPFTPSQLQAFQYMGQEHRNGRRLFILRGPASSGKDTLAWEFAAGQILPAVPIQFGGSASSGVESAVGVDSMTREIVGGIPELDENGNLIMEPVYETDKDGRPIPGEDGKPIPKMNPENPEEPLMVPKMQGETAVTVSGVSLGQIGRIAQEPVCFIISDPDGHEKEMARLHAAFGDNVGDTTGRYIMVDASTGEHISVHPETCFVVTTNEVDTDMNPGGKFGKPAISRAAFVDVDSPTEKEEARRLAHMTNAALKHKTPHGITNVSMAPSLEELEITEEEVAPFVRIQQKLSAAARAATGGIDDELVARETANLAASFFARCIGTVKAEDPTEMVMTGLHRLIDSDNHTVTQEDKRRRLEAIISEEKDQLTEMIEPIRDRLRSIQKGNGDPLAQERAARASEEAEKETEEAAKETEEV